MASAPLDGPQESHVLAGRKGRQADREVLRGTGGPRAGEVNLCKSPSSQPQGSLPKLGILVSCPHCIARKLTTAHPHSEEKPKSSQEPTALFCLTTSLLCPHHLMAPNTQAPGSQAFLHFLEYTQTCTHPRAFALSVPPGMSLFPSI